jgi:hypothetical protein
MSDAPQSYAHHTRWDPLFHFFILPVTALTVLGVIIHSVAHVVKHPGAESAIHALIHIVMAAAFLALVFKIRLYAVKVQDRVIRLEERLRLATVLPESLRARIPELTTDQLIGLRFASDGELAGLVQRTLNEKLSRDDIKKAIQHWRPDNWRV